MKFVIFKMSFIFIRNFGRLCPLIALFSACIDLEPNPTADFEEFMSAKVDGRDFVATQVSMTFSTGNLLTLRGVASDSTSILIKLGNINQIGTFEVNNGRDNEAVFFDANGNDFSSKRTLIGSIEVTQLNQVTVQGSFNFDGKNNNLGMVNVSNGVFAAARD